MMLLATRSADAAATSFASYLDDWLPRFGEAAVVTAQLSLLGFALALLLGAGLAAALASRHGLLRVPARLYVQFMRTVPLLALLLLIYFGLPPLGLRLGSFTAGFIGLGLHGAAHVAIAARAALQSLHRGQREAALAAGLTPWLAFVHVLLPQAMRVMLPPLLNTYVALLKDSSLCALIACDELMLAARAMASEYFLPMPIFLLAGLFYFAVAFPLSMLSRWLERRLNSGRRSVGA